MVQSAFFAAKEKIILINLKKPALVLFIHPLTLCHRVNILRKIPASRMNVISFLFTR